MVDLINYASNNISNYGTITSIPQENIEYLSSGLRASSIGAMFAYCRKLTSIPWNDFNIDTSRCTGMSKVFEYCEALTSLDLSNMDTSSCIEMDSMFQFCRAITDLDLSNFNTSKVTTMNWMFYYCVQLTSLNLSNWDTHNVEVFATMFQNCRRLTTLDISSFDTSNGYTLAGMFEDCISLKEIKGIIDMKRCSTYGANHEDYYRDIFKNVPLSTPVKIKNPPQQYYDDKTAFESAIGLTSDQYEIVS